MDDPSEFSATDKIPGLLVQGIGPLVEHHAEYPVRLCSYLVHLLHRIGIDACRLLTKIVQAMLEGVDSVNRVIVVRTCGNHGIDKAAVHECFSCVEVCNLVPCKGLGLFQFLGIDICNSSQPCVVHLARKKGCGVLIAHVSETDYSNPDLVHHFSS